MIDSADFSIGERKFRADLDSGVSLAIELDFHGKQPRVFGSPPAKAAPVVAGDYVGSVREGGPCNVEQITVSFHTSGTHTECVGHISRSRISITDVVEKSLIPATLITVTPEAIGSDSYHVPTEKGELFITRSSLEEALAESDGNLIKGLVVRTLPNDESKLTRDYDRESFPFFSNEAMRHIREWGVRHLLVDIPSVDRADDGGQLGNHRIFWNVAAGDYDIDPENCSRRTITEMIFVPDSVKDGNYLLGLQLPAFLSDAAPSRPIVYPVHEVD